MRRTGKDEGWVEDVATRYLKLHFAFDPCSVCAVQQKVKTNTGSLNLRISCRQSTFRDEIHDTCESKNVLASQRRLPLRRIVATQHETRCSTIRSLGRLRVLFQPGYD
jgi:hypothetical protein